MLQKKAVKKATKKAPAKKVVKKVTKKTTTRKPKTVDVKVAAEPDDNVSDTAGINVDGVIQEALHRVHMDMDAHDERGQFSAVGMLDMRIRDTVNEARQNVVNTVREMIDAAFAMRDGGNSLASERNVLIARQRLAIAEFELAMDNLESAVRN